VKFLKNLPKTFSHILNGTTGKKDFKSSGGDLNDLPIFYKPINFLKQNTMRTIYLIIGVLFLFTNCNRTDYKDLDSIAKGFPKALESGDEGFTSELFLKGYKTSVKKDIKEAYALLEGKNIEFLKSETSRLPYDESSILKIFFRAGGEYFSLKTEYAKREFGENHQLTGFHLKNLNELCDEYKESPYTPYGLRSLKMQYRFHGGTFEDAKIRVRNDTDYDIDYIKLRLKLFNKNNRSPFFNQTIVSERPVYKGDISNINIKGLEGFYIDDRNLDLSMRVELLEVRPKPKSKECKIIEELKQL
jgi:hypothetical protein